MLPLQRPGTLWEVKVHMERWRPGSQITLNFVGEQLRAHPLRVAGFQLSDVVNQIDLTYHSVVLEMRNSPVHEFSMMAYGVAEALGKLACCCAEQQAMQSTPYQTRRTVHAAPAQMRRVHTSLSTSTQSTRTRYYLPDFA